VDGADGKGPLSAACGSSSVIIIEVHRKLNPRPGASYLWLSRLQSGPDSTKVAIALPWRYAETAQQRKSVRSIFFSDAACGYWGGS
jgi:hypothetical protein